MRYQDFTSEHDPVTGETNALSSAFVSVDRNPDTNPAIFCDCSDLPSLTRQEYAAEADINTLMAQYEKTGILPTVNTRPPDYFDVSDVPDFQTALEFVSKADAAFMSLPAQVRATFENSAANFIAFAENPENLDQMRKWGLAPPLPVDPPPQRVEVVNPVQDAPKAS